MSSADQQLQRLIDFIATPVGAIGVAAVVMLALFSVSKPLIAWTFLVAATLTASLSQSESAADDELLALAPGLAQLQAYGRVISIAGLAGTLPFLLSPDLWRMRMPGARPLNTALLVLHGVIVLKFIEYRLSAYALLGGITYGLMFFVLGVNQIRWVPAAAAAVWPLRAIAAASCLFILGVGYQAVNNLSPMLGNSGRLQGLTTNPQHAATLLAAAFPAICGLWEIDQRSKWLRWGYLALIGLSAVLIAWTSSRTGALMCTVSLMVLYRRQLHKFAFIALLAVSFIAGASQYFTEYGSNAEMLTRTEDTRTEVWASQWRTFVRHPISGAPFRGQQRLGFGENSWLSAASAFGLIGLVPLLIVGAYAVRLCRDCLRLPEALNPWGRRIGETVAAGFAAIAVGSIFESYLLGVLNFQLFAIGLYAMAGYAVVEASGNESNRYHG